MGVLGGKYSMNPYKLGYCMFLDIEERWNKGKFGQEYEDEQDVYKKEHWDKKLGLGHEKVFEVRKYYDDVTAINEFFTPEFCNKYEFFEWKKYPNGEYKIENRDPDKIKKKLMGRHLNGGLPEIRLTDPNFRGQGQLMLQHSFDGRPLLDNYLRATLQAAAALWQDEVHLATRNKNGEEVVYTAFGPDEDSIVVRTRSEFEADE
jgi:stage V sporulation protein R